MTTHELIVIGIVFLLVLIDYVTGVVNAVMHSELSSEKMRRGLGHKFAYLAIICLALIVEYGSGYINLGIELPVFMPVCSGVCPSPNARETDGPVRAPPWRTSHWDHGCD